MIRAFFDFAAKKLALQTKVKVEKQETIVIEHATERLTIQNGIVLQREVLKPEINDTRGITVEEVHTQHARVAHLKGCRLTVERGDRGGCKETGWLGFIDAESCLSTEKIPEPKRFDQFDWTDIHFDGYQWVDGSGEAVPPGAEEVVIDGGVTKAKLPKRK
jgi:hypothetical protein